MIRTGQEVVIQNVETKLFLDVNSGSMDDKAPIIQWCGNYKKHQKFVLEYVKGKGAWLIKSLNSKKAIEIPKNENGNGIVQSAITKFDNQLWHILVCEDTNIIMSVSSKKVLDIDKGSKENGIQVQQWDMNGKEHQQWNIKSI